ncbi:hypothetical protein [Roseateles cavernae]|uniref:hypothetical protein n=1 Tax=Roseateles cavernae TaxID=3153578 RepID=UPI0032E497A1
MRITLFLLCCLALPAAADQPYTPASEAELVERLPTRLGAEQRRLRAQLVAAPTTLPLALQLAREAIARARAQGDPRELGLAQAALAPWWSQPAPPAPVRLLRATIAQSQHRFDAALADLDTLLAAPGTPAAIQAQAELSRAALLQLRGRLPEAQAGCQRLADSHGHGALHGQVCLAELASLQGRGDAASRELARLARQPGAPAGWIALLRAELAHRRGEPAAETLYRRALELNDDVYTRAAYADWLLERQRWPEVIGLLQGGESADALLLRLAIAWQRSGDAARAKPAMAELQARFEAARLRGDGGHERELARFALDLQGDAKAALAHAEANWAQQREPADALLLARARQAAR